MRIDVTERRFTNRIGLLVALLSWRWQFGPLPMLTKCQSMPTLRSKMRKRIWALKSTMRTDCSDLYFLHENMFVIAAHCFLLLRILHILHQLHCKLLNGNNSTIATAV